MIMNWLRTSNIAAGILAVMRIYLGWLWLSTGLGKVTTEGGWSACWLLK